MKKLGIYFAIGIVFVGMALTYHFVESGSHDVANVDADKNGVWDDLDGIIEKYAKTPEQKEALRFYFIAHQEAILHPEIGTAIKDGHEADRLKDKTFISDDCVEKVWSTGTTPLDLSSIKDEMLSSKSRLVAWLKFNQNLSGSFYDLWDEEKYGSSCAVLRKEIDGK